jgi:hypothetical protein
MKAIKIMYVGHVRVGQLGHEDHLGHVSHRYICRACSSLMLCSNLILSTRFVLVVCGKFRSEMSRCHLRNVSNQIRDYTIQHSWSRHCAHLSSNSCSTSLVHCFSGAMVSSDNVPHV